MQPLPILPEPDLDPALCMRAAAVPGLWLLLLSVTTSEPMRREWGAGPSHALCVNGHTEHGLGASLLGCPIARGLLLGAPKGRGLGLLCAKPLRLELNLIYLSYH